MVWAAEAAVAAWGYSLVVFNSDEKPDAEQRILSRVRMLSCDGLMLVPVGDSTRHLQLDADSKPMPTVLFGRTVRRRQVRYDHHRQCLGRPAGDGLSARPRPPPHRLGHRAAARHHRHSGRLDGMLTAMQARGLAPEPQHVRSGEFREDAAYSVARSLLEQPDRPTALYVASGVMALGVMRAIADSDLRCPADISIASTDTIPGIGGLRPRLTRTEHPVVDMTNEAVRLLVDRIRRGDAAERRNVVFQPIAGGRQQLRAVAGRLTRHRDSGVQPACAGWPADAAAAVSRCVAATWRRCRRRRPAR